jgi:hypothetical protein
MYSSPSSSHNAGGHRHGRVETVLRLAGASVVENALTGRPANLRHAPRPCLQYRTHVREMGLTCIVPAAWQVACCGESCGGAAFIPLLAAPSSERMKRPPGNLGTWGALTR